LFRAIFITAVGSHQAWVAILYSRAIRPFGMNFDAVGRADWLSPPFATTPTTAFANTVGISVVAGQRAAGKGFAHQGKSVSIPQPIHPCRPSSSRRNPSFSNRMALARSKRSHPAAFTALCVSTMDRTRNNGSV